MPEGNLISLMLSILAGAGFDKVAGGVNKLSQSGQDLQQLFSLPNMPLFLAGAGLKDTANSMEIAGPILKQLMPPSQPQQPQQDPRQISAAMQMLSARLGPGLSGIRPPAGAPAGVPAGAPMGGVPGGAPPMGAPPMGVAGPMGGAPISRPPGLGMPG